MLKNKTFFFQGACVPCYFYRLTPQKLYLTSMHWPHRDLSRISWLADVIGDSFQVSREVSSLCAHSCGGSVWLSTARGVLTALPFPVSNVSVLSDWGFLLGMLLHFCNKRPKVAGLAENCQNDENGKIKVI